MALILLGQSGFSSQTSAPSCLQRRGPQRKFIEDQACTLPLVPPPSLDSCRGLHGPTMPILREKIPESLSPPMSTAQLGTSWRCTSPVDCDIISGCTDISELRKSPMCSPGRGKPIIKCYAIQCQESLSFSSAPNKSLVPAGNVLCPEPHPHPLVICPTPHLAPLLSKTP